MILINGFITAQRYLFKISLLCPTAGQSPLLSTSLFDAMLGHSFIYASKSSHLFLGLPSRAWPFSGANQVVVWAHLCGCKEQTCPAQSHFTWQTFCTISGIFECKVVFRKDPLYRRKESTKATSHFTLRQAYVFCFLHFIQGINNKNTRIQIQRIIHTQVV